MMGYNAEQPMRYRVWEHANGVFLHERQWNTLDDARSDYRQRVKMQRDFLRRHGSHSHDR